jgi:hypothetical protein
VDKRKGIITYYTVEDEEGGSYKTKILGRRTNRRGCKLNRRGHIVNRKKAVSVPCTL